MAYGRDDNANPASMTSSGQVKFRTGQCFSITDKQLNDHVYVRHHGEQEKNIPDEKHQKISWLGSTDSHGASKSMQPGTDCLTMTMADGHVVVIGTTRPVGHGIDDNGPKAGQYDHVPTMDKRWRQNRQESKTAPTHKGDQDTTEFTKTQQTKGSHYLAQGIDDTEPLDSAHKKAKSPFNKTGYGFAAG